MITTTMTTSATDSTPALSRRLCTATVGGALLTSGLALSDATIRATGGVPAWDDASGFAPAVVAAMAVHALTYALFAATLAIAASPIDAGRGGPRIVRRLLVGSLAGLAGGFTGLSLMHSAGATAPVAMQALTGVSFVLIFVLAAALGAVLPRRSATRLSKALLLSIPFLVALTAGMAAAGSDWAHPAYAETALYAGLAALALNASRDTAGAAASTVRAGRSS